MDLSVIIWRAKWRVRPPAERQRTSFFTRGPANPPPHVFRFLSSSLLSFFSRLFGSSIDDVERPLRWRHHRGRATNAADAAERMIWAPSSAPRRLRLVAEQRMVVPSSSCFLVKGSVSCCSLCCSGAPLYLCPCSRWSSVSTVLPIYTLPGWSAHPSLLHLNW